MFELTKKHCYAGITINIIFLIAVITLAVQRGQSEHFKTCSICNRREHFMMCGISGCF